MSLKELNATRIKAIEIKKNSLLSKKQLLDSRVEIAKKELKK